MNREPTAQQAGVVVDMRFDGALPAIHTLLRAGDGGRVAIEVLAQRDARQVRGIALTPTQELARGMPVENTGGPLQAPVGKPILSRMLDVFGNTIDGASALAGVEGVSIFCGIGERSREGEELYREMKAAGVLPHRVMIFAQMNEPPGARFRVGHAALMMAKYFRDDEHRDVLLLVDNIFRFIQAGSEVSGLMGQMPSRLGYQPTMGTELADADQLTDADREQVTEAARQALATFKVRAESNPDPPAAGPETERQGA